MLIEYAYNLDIPDEVMDHPLIGSLGEAANDLVTWSNVCVHFTLERRLINISPLLGSLLVQR